MSATGFRNLLRVATSSGAKKTVRQRPKIVSSGGILRVLFIRHAESLNNVLGKECGKGSSFEKGRSPDPALSEKGLEQAQHLAQFLQHNPSLYSFEEPHSSLDAIYCSGMLRALQTAQPIGEALDVAPEVWVEMHETGGMYHEEIEKPQCGMGRVEMAKQFPSYVLPSTCFKSGWWFGGREDHNAADKRTSRVVRQLWSEASRCHALRVIAVVSHGHFMARLVQELLGTGASVKFDHTNTGVTCLELPSNERLGIQVRYVNQVPVRT